MRSPRDADEMGRADAVKTPVRRRLRVGRVLATSTATCVLAAAFLAAPVAGLPWNPVSAEQDAPSVGAGVEGVSVGVVGASSVEGPTTVEEVLDVLERAELASKDAGRTVSPEVEQAAAELGMLLSAYLAQHPTGATPATPFASPDAETPTPLVTDPPADLPTSVPGVADAVTVANHVSGGPAGDEGDASDPAPEAGDGPAKAGVLPGPRVPVTGTTPDGAVPGSGAEDVTPPESQHDAEAVTFDDVVVAATRLATLLDPSMTTLAAGILPAGAAGAEVSDAARATLTASLRELVDRYGNSTSGYANGRIPASALCPLDFAPGHMLRCDAAEQLEALSVEYEKEFGVPIPMTDSYRTFDTQVRLKATKGYLAATPGWSNHGWGLAVDLGVPINSGTTAQYVWMRVHGPDYGWDNPSWARLDGSKPEPWHFEFFAAGPIPNRAWKADDVGATGAAQDKAAQHGPGSTSGADGAKGTTSKGGTSDGSKSDGKKAGGSSSGGTSKPGTTDGSAGAPIKKPGDSTPDKPEGPTAPVKVTVPDVSGMGVDAATAKLQKLGLKVDTTTRASDAPAGQVLRTSGAGTKVTKGTTISLVVSSGPVTVKVPDVTGWTVADARAKLKSLGFVVVTDPADGVDDGDLVVATKGAGTAVPKGSTVVLSWGDAAPVPDVAGKTVAEARAVLEEAGFEVTTDPAEGVADDAVVTTTVDAGTVRLKGSTVTLIVAADGSATEPDGAATDATDDPAATGTPDAG
ncbi:MULTISPECIES: PASTA domain-containing protein [unclassified Isoptericola]|uniref:PASTA domain-containing protein n=1 Tax=unclassified Isoptericola TaxID=2623355 RepID=UPI00365E1C74